MKVLGSGRANGAISILHALGTGRGCSVGIQLDTVVQIIDKPNEVNGDRHGLLASVETCWRDAGLPIPDEFGWKVELDPNRSRAQIQFSSLLCCIAGLELLLMDGTIELGDRRSRD